MWNPMQGKENILFLVKAKENNEENWKTIIIKGDELEKVHLDIVYTYWIELQDYFVSCSGLCW